jgi:flagellar biosynthesis protein FlhF
MKIKKFTAKTFSEALALVKKELGQDAVILSSEEKKGLRRQVEVTAGSDEGPNEGVVLGSQLAAYHSSSQDRSVTHNSHSELPARSDAGGDLRSEIRGLRAMVESMKNSGYEVSLPAKKREVLNFLRERSVREEFALRLCDRTSEVSEVPLMLSADIQIKRLTGMKKAVMFIGPTGVGKTTTIAKLAAQAVKSGKKAAVINLDTYRIGAAEQARIYTRILGIPLATASGAAELHQALAKFAGSKDVIFIDTTGRNPKDTAYLQDMAELCKTDVPLELHLLMSAVSDDECMIEAYRSYRNLPIDYIGFTKIDEAVRYGSLYNLLLTYQKPVAYLTTGQQVPGDIEQATVNRIARLIVHKECAA